MKPFSLLQNQSAHILSLLDSTKDTVSLAKIHGLLILVGFSRSLPFQTKLLSSYGSLGNVDCARKVFDRIPDPDLYSWKVMLRCYLMNERYHEAIAFYGHMRRYHGEQDNVVHSSVLKACVKLLDLSKGKILHSHVTKYGSPDCFVLNVLIDMYAKCGDMEYARRVFDKIPDRNMVSYTSVITGLVHSDNPREGLVMFNQMRQERVKPTEHTVGSLLVACSMSNFLHQGNWIHAYVIKEGMFMNSFIGTALLDMYVKCGDVVDARTIFDGLDDVVDLVLWTAMIVGYTQSGIPGEALKLFTGKKWACIVPNAVTIASALSASAQLKNLMLGRSIQVLAVKLGVEGCPVVMNSLVDMYAKCWAIREATCLFERIVQKDLVAWNSMIAGFAQNELGYESLSLFNRMSADGYFPDAITVVGALSACIYLGTLDIGSCLHGFAIKLQFLSNIYVSTAILNLYSKCGDVISAHRVFDEMGDRNTVTWCAMMGGYGMHGNYIVSSDLFGKMLKEDLQPNDVTFTSILATCSHTGMVGEGKKYFENMSRQYNIVPSMKHYVCMVDMLSRAGNLEEALEFIEGMPVQADISVWVAFLHGCRLHSKLELGEVAVKMMMDLQPESPDYYILMCNLYASDGRWTEAIKIRELMKERGLTKLPGWSFVQLDNRLHPLVSESMFDMHTKQLGHNLHSFG